MPLLTNTQIAKKMTSLKGWKLVGSEIRKTWEMEDFVHAIGFVSSISLLAERANHHPDIDIRWNRITLALSTHSAGGLTIKDFELAAEIDTL